MQTNERTNPEEAEWKALLDELRRDGIEWLVYHFERVPCLGTWSMVTADDDLYPPRPECAAQLEAAADACLPLIDDGSGELSGELKVPTDGGPMQCLAFELGRSELVEVPAVAWSAPPELSRLRGFAVFAGMDGDCRIEIEPPRPIAEEAGIVLRTQELLDDMLPDWLHGDGHMGSIQFRPGERPALRYREVGERSRVRLFDAEYDGIVACPTASSSLPELAAPPPGSAGRLRHAG